MFSFVYLHSFISFIATAKKLGWLTFYIALSMIVATASSATANPLTRSSTSRTNIASVPTNDLKSNKWTVTTAEEEKEVWNYILNSPLGIAALNQLAIEDFISPNCPKTFYIDHQSGGFRTLLQVKCSEERGTSASASYLEMHVVFERFENNIESFQVKRIYPDVE